MKSSKHATASTFRIQVLALALLSGIVPWSHAQLSASDDFESYTGNPVGASGGSGDWTSTWGANSQFGGGTFLSSDSKINGTKSLGMYGNGSTAGTSVSRPFPACTNIITIAGSMRGDFNANSTNAPNPRRMAFTIRSGNDSSHFVNQRLSFFFAAGTTNLQWYDGTDRITSAVNFTLGHVYDLNVVMNPTNRAYSFTISNRNNSTTFSYSGNWSLGFNGEPIGSVAFFMRGPTGAGNDAFLDNVTISSPDYVPVPEVVVGPDIREGAMWRYFKGTSTPAVQGTNQWYDRAFNDAGWSGPSPSGFGYSDCDDATTLSDMLNGYTTLFTRKAFVVTNAGSITHLTLAADYDDGFVAFLNGVEVARRNVTGPVSHTTIASAARESSRGESAADPQPKEFIGINPALLVNGTNVIAVSVHNTGASSSDASLIIELYTNSTLARGPFVQMPDAGNKATIAWSTAAAVDGAVDYGLDLSYGAGTVSNASLVRSHALVLTGLLPGTTYYYRVRSNGEVLSAGNTFVTRADTSQKFRFVVIGDHGQGTAWMYNIASRINARQDFDLMLTVGDNVYGYTPAGCNTDGAPGWYDPYFFQLYGPSMKRVPMFPALGNHDKDTADGNYTVEYFHLPTNGPAGQIEKNYSFEYGNIHFTVIDSDPFANNDTATMASITSWLSNDVATATQKWKMAFYHHPAFTSQGSHNDNANVKAQIIPTLKAGGFQYIFQGHNHFYERINAIDGIHYSTCGACGAYLYGISNRKEYSAQLIADRHSYTVVDINGSRFKLEQFDESDVLVDTFNLDIDHEFEIDGLLDNPTWLRSQNGLRLYAAIRGFNLYVATQDAGEGSDHFIYVADTISTQRPANWAKSGTIMRWGAMLADENDGAFQGWFGADQQALTDFDFYKSMTSGLNNNAPYGTNGVLEGSIDLAGHFGTFPQQLFIAAAPYGTTDGGALNSGFQVPAGNGNGDIESNEFLALNARDIALDLPVAEAGNNQNVEAGMWAVLNGGASYAPAGLPFSYNWQQLAGPAVNAVNLGTQMPAFVITSNVAVNTPVTFRLRINDGRFDSDDDTVTVTLMPMVDTDGDGLSDNEELTGFDNLLTAANPSGKTSNPNLADSDGDNVNDGDEALAGTDPGNAASVFKIVSENTAASGTIQIDWNTVSGRLYNVEFAESSLTNPWSWLTSFTATSAISRIEDTNSVNFIQRYYRIGVE